MRNLPPLAQQAVRDLAWAIFAPNLIDDYRFHPLGGGIGSCHMALTEQRRQWLVDLDRNPAPLLDILSGLKSTRLGIYFEALWQFFIRCDPAFTLLAANLPVHDHGRTLGEFDLIYRDNGNGAAVHLELATKYYLNTLEQKIDGAEETHPIPLHNWLGPNTRDRLGQKLQRLLSHQARLSESTRGGEVLLAHGIRQVRPQIALKGFLFYQPRGLALAAADSFPLNPEHNRGTWMSSTDFLSHPNTSEYWHILQRPHWISPACIHRDTMQGHILPSSVLRERVAQHFLSDSAPALMICAMQASGDYFGEVSRCVITGDNWPDREE